MITEETVVCQPSWVMRSDSVRMAVTHLGAHLAPVYFYCNESAPIQPYHISPWQCEDHPFPQGHSEHVLRGDFFCLPFGYAEPEIGGPPHGKTAGERWALANSCSRAGIHELRIHMTGVLGWGRVTRQFFLRNAENAVYDRTTVEGITGDYTLGHHAVLRLPPEYASLLVSTSQQIFGMTYPQTLSDEGGAGSQSLLIAAPFDTLAAVPSSTGGAPPVDCASFPTCYRSTDLLQIGVAANVGEPAWTAAVNTTDGYLWYSFRDTALLPSTLLWVENEGRQNTPWNGRNRSLGLEDVCSFFDCGSKISSAANPFSDRGIKTVQSFHQDHPLTISYIQGVVRTPPGFGRVRSVRFAPRNATFTDVAGLEVSANVFADFVFGQILE